MRSQSDLKRYYLCNCEEYPRRSCTPFIPCRASRDGLEPGDVALLIFKPAFINPGDRVGETQWVEVLEATADLAYVGRILEGTSDAPIEDHTLLRFRPEHIFGIITGEEECRDDTYDEPYDHDDDDD